MSAQNSLHGLSLRWRILLPAAGSAVVTVILGLWILSMPDVEMRAGIPLFIVAAALLPLIPALIIGMRTASRARQAAVAVEQLAAGHRTARAETGPRDELGRVNEALNIYAAYVQEKADDLRAQLRAARYDSQRLESAIANMPDGVVVLDLSGSVILMNTIARSVLGASQHTDDSVRLTAAVTPPPN